MSNYRIRMLPGVLIPVRFYPDGVIWQYEPTQRNYYFRREASTKEIVQGVVGDLTREWERLTNDQMSCHACNLTWDINDPHPPTCRNPDRGQPVKAPAVNQYQKAKQGE